MKGGGGMPTINEVLERVNRARPDALDDGTKAAWLIELDGKLYREVVLRHGRREDEEEPELPKKYPEDADKELLVGPPYDNLYDLYIMAQADLYNREDANYNNSALVFNTALDEFKKAYHREHRPLGPQEVRGL
jgi:hypothetical protein